MAVFVAYTIIGLSLGGIFALAALGIVLIYRTTGVLNFAHGAMGMFSTFVAWQFFYGWAHPDGRHGFTRPPPSRRPSSSRRCSASSSSSPYFAGCGRARQWSRL
ncbi:MAG TPA: hypothetical protein VNG04_03680 [Candidatus Acidoferrum sp.]|nr:hypothetical protein [Candidatus Acidoferrum sp.]